jgi:hypothetical protein
MFVKAALFYLAYLELRKLGADYRSALATPTSVSSGGGSATLGAGGEPTSSYQKFQSGTGSGAHVGGAAAESIDSDVYKSAAAGYNAPGAAAGVVENIVCRSGGQPSWTDAGAGLRAVCAAIHGLPITLSVPSCMQMRRPTADRTSRRRASSLGGLPDDATVATCLSLSRRRSNWIVWSASYVGAQRPMVQYWRVAAPDVRRRRTGMPPRAAVQLRHTIAHAHRWLNCDRDAESPRPALPMAPAFACGGGVPDQWRSCGIHLRPPRQLHSSWPLHRGQHVSRSEFARR